MPRIRSFNDMVSDPSEELCGVCDIHGSKLCEGRWCLDAYKTYANDILEPEESMCDTCRNSGQETMDAVAACNCCDGYEYYSPEDDDG